MRLTAIAILSLAAATPALAEITVNEAGYTRGALVVRGETSRPQQKVTIDGRYSTRTDRNNRFRFRLRYLPPDCSISIRAGSDVRPAVLSNCKPRPVDGPQRPWRRQRQ